MTSLQILQLLLAALGGGCLWYLFFYRRYENRELVNELRKNNLELKQLFQSCDRDRLEYEQQNEILKDEVSILYQKNDDLTHVVSELSRYYYHMKKVSNKMTELSTYLQQPLDDLDTKMSPYLRPQDVGYENESDEFVYKLNNDDTISQKWFF
jgi:uncharacterized protein HemX